VDVLPQVGRQSLLAVGDDLGEEGLDVAALMGADDRRLGHLARAGVGEDVGVAVPVPAGDPVATEKLEDRIRIVLPGHDDPHVDAVLTHER